MFGTGDRRTMDGWTDDGVIALDLFIVKYNQDRTQTSELGIRTEDYCKENWGVLNFEIICPSKGLYQHVSPPHPHPGVSFEFKVHCTEWEYIFGYAKISNVSGLCLVFLITCWESIAR